MIITALKFFIVFLSIAVIVYPDKMLVMVLRRSGRPIRWLHVIIAELVVIPVFLYTMTLLPTVYRHLGKYYPVVDLVALAIFRLIYCLLATLFSSDD